ncbi:MAG: hypothetical protein CL979_02535 [Euryarchaeota archaeon]|nr:hypothetical protein [Euryarchaeota archaeon]
MGQKTLEIQVTSTSSGGSNTLLLVGIALLLLGVAAALGAVAFTRGGRDISSILPGRSGPASTPTAPEPTTEQEPTAPHAEQEGPASQEGPELQRFPDYPGWLWNPATEEWVADPEYDDSEQ